MCKRLCLVTTSVGRRCFPCKCAPPFRQDEVWRPGMSKTKQQLKSNNKSLATVSPALKSGELVQFWEHAVTRRRPVQYTDGGGHEARWEGQALTAVARRNALTARTEVTSATAVASGFGTRRASTTPYRLMAPGCSGAISASIQRST